MKKILIAAIVLSAMLNFFVSADAAGQSPGASGAGRRVPSAPDFKLKDLNGNDVALSDFKGKKVLLSFGATWCPYCVAEVGQLNAFYAKHQDKDVKLLYVDIQESAAKVANFVQTHNIKYAVLLDADGKVARDYNVYGIPTIFFIDETGIIKYQGGEPEGGFEELLK